MIVLPPLGDAHEQGFHDLIELQNLLPSRWTLVEGRGGTRHSDSLAGWPAGSLQEGSHRGNDSRNPWRASGSRLRAAGDAPNAHLHVADRHAIRLMDIALDGSHRSAVGCTTVPGCGEPPQRCRVRRGIAGRTPGSPRKALCLVLAPRCRRRIATSAQILQLTALSR